MDLSAQQILELDEGFRKGLNLDEACLYAKITDDDYIDYAKAHTGWHQENKKKALYPIIKAKETIVANLDKVDNAQWYLKKKAPLEFGDKTTQEHTGTVYLAPVYFSDGPRIDSKPMLVNTMPDEFESRINAIEANPVQ